VSEHAVEVRTADGLSLVGLHLSPDGNSDPACAVVWLHGFGARYDLPQFVALGRELNGLGIGFLTCELRGHDGAATGWRYRDGRPDFIRVGSWWEVFEDASQDIAAWVTFAHTLPYASVVLAGHSFGALHAVHYLASAPDSGVAAIALASPSFGLRSLQRETAELADALVAAGKGEDLLPPGSWPRGFGTTTVSAQTYASWWRVAPRFFGESPSFFHRLSIPVLIMYGTRSDVGGAAELEYLASLATHAPAVETRLLDGVTHAFNGAELAVSSALDEWLRRTLPVLPPNEGA